MAKRLVFNLPAPITREDWIKHFIDHHAQVPDAPSPDDLRKYPAAFFKVLEDHNRLHRAYYVGHEHQGNLIVPGRLS